MPPNHLDPASALVMLLTVLVGPAAAAVLGPYAVIIFASLIGGGWSLGRRDATQRGKALVFLLLITGTAVMLTTGLAVFANRWWGDADGVNWMLAPIGLVIGAIGHDWPRVGRWLIGRVGRLIDRRIDGGAP